MLCTRCKKRQAVVFVQRLENGKPVQEGYCLTCARELHIQPVDDLMKRFNMTDDQLASMEDVYKRQCVHRALCGQNCAESLERQTPGQSRSAAAEPQKRTGRGR